MVGGERGIDRIKSDNRDYDFFVRKIGNFLNNLPSKVNIDIAGNGEPSLHPITVDLVEHLCGLDNIHKVTLFSNMTCSHDFMDRIGGVINQKFKMACSYHTEFVIHPEFVDKVKYLSGIVDDVSIVVQMNPHDFEYCKSLVKKLMDDLRGFGGVRIIPNVLSFPTSLPHETYSKEQQEYFFDNIKYGKIFNHKGQLLTRFDVIFNNIRDFRGWYCMDAKKNIKMNLKGDVYSMCLHRSLGNIYFDTVDFGDTFDVGCCDTAICTCTHRLKLPKRQL